jgi:predicted glycoside hydrolase/deacetylase ChbG (UPF0249 family)
VDDEAQRRSLLIVNADDYGLTVGVSRAILRAAADGIVTSTSILAVAPGFDRTVRWLHNADIGVGAHLAVVGEDPALLSAHEIPTLVDRRGALPRSWRQLLPRVATGRIDPADLRREFSAQIERTASTGVRLTHVDTHQHVHLWPPVAEIVMDVAADVGVSAIRIIRSTARTPVGATVRHLARRLERRCRERGFRFPATATGLDEAGRLRRDRLTAAVGALASAQASSAELATHPGEADDPDLERYRWGYHWAEELDALCSSAARTAVSRAGFRLGTYADLATA